MSNLPTGEATIFSTHLADGSKAGIQLFVDQSAEVKAYAIDAASTKFEFYSADSSLPIPKLTLNTWHLVGFTFIAKAGVHMISLAANLFVDHSQFRVQTALFGGSAGIDISTIKILRVGGTTDSFVADVTALRVMSPGALYLPETACSASNAIELGSDSFALACAAGSPLSTSDSKCYETCPTGTELSIETPISLCMELPVKTTSIIKSDGGLSGTPRYLFILI